MNDNHIKYENGWYGISIPEASEIIEQESRSALVRKYGSQPDKAIVSRFNKELEIIKKYQKADHYYLAYLVAKRCDELGYVHSLRGCGGSSLIAYLLGITEVNPLPPHYYCPKCGQVEYVDEYLFPSATDLNNKGKKCSHCGWKMTSDGQNSPCEFFLGLGGDKRPDFVFNVPYRKDIFEYLGERFGKDKVFNEAQISNGNIQIYPGRIIIVPDKLDIHSTLSISLSANIFLSSGSSLQIFRILLNLFKIDTPSRKIFNSSEERSTTSVLWIVYNLQSQGPFEDSSFSFVVSIGLPSTKTMALPLLLCLSPSCILKWQSLHKHMRLS